MPSEELLLGSGAAFTTSEKLAASTTTQSQTAITFLEQAFLPVFVVANEDFRVTDSP
jgi:hypothetical protein